MVKRKSTRHYSFLPDTADDSTHARSASQQTQAATADAPGGSTSHTPVSSPPAKRRRSIPSQSSPLTPLGTSSPSAPATTAHVPTRIEQPRVSLARLPLDILQHIGHFLLPVPVPLLDPSSSSSPGRGSESALWVDPGTDLVAFTSTCRALWASSRDFVGRTFGGDIRGKKDLGVIAGYALERRLECIVSDEEYDEQHSKAAREGVDAGRSVAIPGAPGVFRSCFAPLERWEYVPASRVRHLYLAVAGNEDIFFADGKGTDSLGVVVAKTLAKLPNLESVAIVWRTEMEVIEKTPYSLVKLPADMLVALAAHPTLRDLFLCGVKFSRHFCDNTRDFPADDSVRFQPSFTTLTINACHDSALECITMAPSVKEVRAWRDYCKVPRISNEYWWNKESWKTVQRLDLSGFSGQQGLSLIQHWQQQLVSLRSISPPVDVPLHTLRLSEPYALPTLRDDILPALANLPHLKSLHVIVWNERHFGAPFLRAIHDALPDLEELSIGLESEALQWWQGQLTDYSVILHQFRNLRTFTWNYSPYADLDYSETRKHVLPMLERSFLSPKTLPRNFTTLKWFNEPIELRRVPPPPPVNKASFARAPPPPTWLWSNHARFHRPLPRWAIEALKPKSKPMQTRARQVLELGLSSSGSAVNEDDTRQSLSPVSGSSSAVVVEENRTRSREGKKSGTAKDKGKGKAKATSSQSAHAPLDDDWAGETDGEDDEQEANEGGATRPLFSLAPKSDSSTAPHLRRGPRKSIGELLALAKTEEVRKGKMRAVEEDEDEVAAGGLAGEKGDGMEDDSGFFEMQQAEL